MTAQAGLAKNQMMLFYTGEMMGLQNDLQAASGNMAKCNWTCVSECSKIQVEITTKANCLDTCKCYEGAKA